MKFTFYSGVYAFKAGSRVCNYCLIKDLPPEFFPPKKAHDPAAKPARKVAQLTEGQERVWDLDKKRFSIINPGNLIGELKAHTDGLTLDDLKTSAPDGNQLDSLIRKIQETGGATEGKLTS